MLANSADALEKWWNIAKAREAALQETKEDLHNLKKEWRRTKDELKYIKE